MSLGLTTKEYNQGPVIVDSGTTNTYFTPQIGQAFERAFLQVTNTTTTFTSLQVRSLAECSRFPDVTFHFVNNVVVRMPCSAYLDCVNSGKGCRSAVHFDASSGAVLGANFMSGKDVVFDWENHQVGFAEADCSYQSRRR